ncbi:DUF1223 domain-containing protein [Frigidibacter sp. ROC022]|uniref:DUF1223 domain-containing protein n=1 Tax=Frigidibacter sp. ROC022 TaxID=2971796 RepID=UPI00215B7500|nr:DUF1223 domain-containing protein [Frigidibacter sp. ROC022]MCR8726309.1 DUF1223 domain-containing protein [Frigidibacter sp. ROC022]
MKTLAIALGAALAIGSAAQAQVGPEKDAAATPLVVVELYTSQGCSSCPPADALLEKLAARSDVLALALHVDYWDYIGWKDTFASPQYTQRQKLYARAAGHRTIYTPQMVIEGQDHVVGFRPMEVADLISRHRDVAPEAGITLSRDGDQLTVRLSPTGKVSGPLVVQLIRFTPSQDVEIERGENAGKRIHYANVVTEWSRIGEWDGRADMAIEAPAAGDAGVAVIVQKKDMGPIVAAAMLK